MKKRVKVGGKFQRRYASNGILMYRERKNLVEIPAGKMVTVLKPGPYMSLCQFGDFTVGIPNENLPAFRNTNKPAQKRQPRAVAAEAAA